MNKNKETQGIIQRLTVQSFTIKGFSFTFIGLIGNILKDSSNYYLFTVSLISVFVFWYLDTYYLRMERIYRIVEDNYDTEKGLSYKNYNVKESFFKVAISKTIWPIYIVQIIFVIALSLTAMGIL